MNTEFLDVTHEPIQYGKPGGNYDLLQGLTKKRQQIINANRAYRQQKRVEHVINPLEDFLWDNPVFHKPPEVLTIPQRFRNILLGGIAYVQKLKAARVGAVESPAWDSGYAEGREPQVQESLQPQT